MNDHPLFPESHDDTPEQAAALNEELPIEHEPQGDLTQLEPQSIPKSEASEVPEISSEPEVSAPQETFIPQETPKQETFAQQPYRYNPYVQQPRPYTPPMPPYHTAPHGNAPMPPPVRPNFDPYTGKPTAKPPKKSKKDSKTKGLGWRLALFGLCVALIGSAAGGLIVGLLLKNQPSQQANTEPTMQEEVLSSNKPTQEPDTQKTTTQTPSASTTPPASLSALYEQAVPSIVGISNEYTTYNYFYQPSTASSTGTGFIISSDGEILTNYHVIENAEKLTVTMYDGTQYPATVLGYEAESDVALLKIDATSLPAVTLGDSDALKVGEQITAIGNPLGELTYTMTVGYVSAKSRAVYTDEKPINMMQIDAAINPGNSGGPLFNMNGEVVGITTAKYTSTQDGSTTVEGIGFAIPINDVLSIVSDLREYGSVQNRAYMGVVVTNSVAGGDIPAGALVQSVDRGDAGETAGLRPNDIITAVDGYKVEDIDTLYQALRPYRGGDTAELTVFRSGDTLTLTITFSTAEDVPEETEMPTENYYNFPWG